MVRNLDEHNAVIDEMRSQDYLNSLIIHINLQKNRQKHVAQQVFWFGERRTHLTFYIDSRAGVPMYSVFI